MRSKFFAVMAFLLIGSFVANAKILTTNIVDDSFAMAPKAVIDTSVDKAYAKATPDTMLFSPGPQNDTLLVWMFEWNFSQNESISILKRSLDATTLQSKGEDIIIKSDIVSKIGPAGKAALGYIGFPTMKDSGKDTADQLFFSTLSTSATSDMSPVEAQITNNKMVDIAYYVVEILPQNDIFYILYSSFNKSSEIEMGVFLQGVKAKDGSLVYDQPIKILSLKSQIGSTGVTAGLDSVVNAANIVVVWKEAENGNLMQTTVSIANGKVAKADFLRSDTDSAMYLPAGLVSSSASYGVIVDKETFESEVPTSTLAVFFNGDTVNPKPLSIKTPQGYASPMVLTFDHDDGFVAIIQYTGEKNYMYVSRSFDNNGKALDTQKQIATTMGMMQFFADASGAIWLGYTNFDDKTGIINKAFLGKLLA